LYSVLVLGPYLVRGASLSSNTLALSGDVDTATKIVVFAPKEVDTVSWNGRLIQISKTTDGSLVGTIKGPNEVITLPELKAWRARDSLPEKNVTYDDSGLAWVGKTHYLLVIRTHKLTIIAANHTETYNPIKPLTLPVLYADEYGFHTGISLYRARISGTPTSLSLSVQGGTAFGFSVFLNSEHIYSYLGTSTSSSKNITIPILPNSLLQTSENVLLVLMDNSGHDQRAGALNPRGILSSSLTNGTFSSWKIAGTAGRESNIDPIRGPLAEGGLTCERLGWHLPGFDASSWSSLAPSKGTSETSVHFYRTTATLSIPSGLDLSIVFTLNTPSNSSNTALRAILWVNGYNYGLFNPSIGHQTDFPVPTGILNLNGENSIGLSVWNQGDGSVPARVDVGWKVAYVHESGFDFGFNLDKLRPVWDESRLVYA
jgi:hypothetical protein